jgi:flagellin-specific chaperone FliS
MKERTEEDREEMFKLESEDSTMPKAIDIINELGYVLLMQKGRIVLDMEKNILCETLMNGICSQ